MHALELLTDDHNKLKTLFGKVNETEDEKTKHKLFRQIRNELESHTRIEEEIFYPAIKSINGLDELVMEGIQEHHQTDVFIREIKNLVDGSDVFDPKLKVLMEGVEHHIQEEEKEMFPKVRNQFSKSELEDLGSKMKAKK